MTSATLVEVSTTLVKTSTSVADVFYYCFYQNDVIIEEHLSVDAS